MFVYYIKFNRQPEVKYGEILSCYVEVGEKEKLRLADVIKNSIRYLKWLEQGSDKFTTRLTISGENIVEFKLPPSQQQQHQERSTDEEEVSKPLEDAPFMVKNESE